jgi:type II secretory pathway predicted ATPase ExeA
MSKKLTALYGLKWNPFLPEVPTEALHVTQRSQSFVWRVEQLCTQGGFASVQGEPGSGKSVTLRIVMARLEMLRDVSVRILSRPQAGLADFYRELGDLYRVKLNPHNRWAGTVALRQSWHAQMEQASFRPVLLIDEAQEARPEVLSELRLLSSTQLDAQSLLTVVLCGDQRLKDKLRLPELLPLDSRIRVRLLLDAASREDLAACLQHALTQAGSPTLMTPQLCSTVCEHAAGNYRVLMNLCHDLLMAAAQRDASQLDEKLFLELFTPNQRPPTKAQGARR